MRTELLRFDGAVERDPAIDAWMKKHARWNLSGRPAPTSGIAFLMTRTVMEKSHGPCGSTARVGGPPAD